MAKKLKKIDNAENIQGDKGLLFLRAIKIDKNLANKHYQVNNFVDYSRTLYLDILFISITINNL